MIEGKLTAVDGLDESALTRFTEAIERDIAADMYDGVAVVVARGGQVGLRAAIGYADRARGRKLAIDDVFRVLSTTKALTNVLTLAAIERGYFALTTKVVDIIPEYVGEQRFVGVKKPEVMVQHLLTHRAAMPSALYPTPLTDDPRMGELAYTVAHVCRTDLVGIPGERVNYSPSYNHVVLAEILRRTWGGGGSYREFLERELLEPAGMTDTHLGAPADLSERLVPLVPKYSAEGWMVPWDITMLNERITAEAEMPWVGSVMTVDDLHRFVEMLRRGGEIDGARILSPAAIKYAARVHTGEQVNDIYGGLAQRLGWPVPPANHGLGFQLRGEGIYKTMFGTFASPGTYGNYGAGSSFFWVDPETDLTLAFLSAGVMEQAANIVRFERLCDMVHAAVV